MNRTFRNWLVIGVLGLLAQLALFAVLAAPACAFAQDTVAVTPPGGPDVPAVNVDELALQALDGVVIGDYWAVWAVVVTLATWLIRAGFASKKVKPRWPRLAAVLDDPLVAYLLPLCLAAGPGLVAVALSGSPLTVGVFIAGLAKVAGGSKVLFLGIKNALEWRHRRNAIRLGPPGAAAALLLLAGPLSGCTASQAFIVSGESIDTLGAQFEKADDLMKKGLAEGKVSNADFRAWTDFSTAFDLTYGEAVSAWKTAQRVKNAVDEKRWGSVLADLGAQLMRFYAKLKEANLLPAGAP